MDQIRRVANSHLRFWFYESGYCTPCSCIFKMNIIVSTETCVLFSPGNIVEGLRLDMYGIMGMENANA